MVKIHGFNEPPAPTFQVGASYVGDSRALGLLIQADYGYPAIFLLTFGNRRPIKIGYEEFARCVDFLESFGSGENSRFDLPEPNPTKLSILMLENSRIFLRWGNTSKVFLPLEFFQTLNLLIALRKKMHAMAKRLEERKMVAPEFSLIDTFRLWGDIIAFITLSFVAMFNFVGQFIWPHLFYYWLFLTIFLGLWLLILQPPWAANFLPAVRSYVNENLLSDLAEIHFPRRSVEIVLIIIIVLTLYLIFGTDAANFIFSIRSKTALP